MKTHHTENQFIAFEQLAQPLHEQLYKKNDFNFINELSDLHQLILTYDYVRNQVLMGGFIQLIQNNYISLLVIVIEKLQLLQPKTEMIAILDDVLKIYVLNIDSLGKDLPVNDFAKLYEEFKEFEVLEEKFKICDEKLIAAIVNCAS